MVLFTFQSFSSKEKIYHYCTSCKNKEKNEVNSPHSPGSDNCRNIGIVLRKTELVSNDDNNHNDNKHCLLNICSLLYIKHL